MSFFELLCRRLYDLPACNKRIEILPLTTAHITNLNSQISHVFALLISMHRFISINFDQTRPKIV